MELLLLVVLGSHVFAPFLINDPLDAKKWSTKPKCLTAHGSHQKRRGNFYAPCAIMFTFEFTSLWKSFVCVTCYNKP